MTIVTTNSGSRGAAARSAAHQALSPAYNVLLRDDKSFPFILLRV
jgi:excinuclease ABC subunit C